ncbi:hypothetical protein OU426_12040 [Frigidibacter sp. RF13]|uniref:hypothetical protein n=1 Tax=Frigidibacter sp. RF13 TaxID=2997340 RepID=UPI00226F14AD|nr:hypothetical protein [Frigidibacter sp. RF13]MCY1127587.1 hypothetical protein [Frigidibacter sp. RF13]
MTSPPHATLRYEPGTGRGLALILAGLTYRSDRPLLAMVAARAAVQGLARLRVDFSYADDPAFMAQEDEAQLARIEADGAALLGEALARSDGRPLWVAGKSLGTIAMGGMMAAPPARALWLWLTPSLRGTYLMERMVLCPGPSFSLIGSRDPSAALCREAAYQGLPGLHHVEIRGTDHGWTHEDGPAATAGAEADAARALAGWLLGVRDIY